MPGKNENTPIQSQNHPPFNLSRWSSLTIEKVFKYFIFLFFQNGKIANQSTKADVQLSLV